MSNLGASDFEWEHFPGYYEQYNCLDFLGRVVGRVSGNRQHPENGWTAIVEYYGVPCESASDLKLGTYRDASWAKSAVERYWRSQAVTKNIREPQDDKS